MGGTIFSTDIIELKLFKLFHSFNFNNLNVNLNE